MGSLIGELVAEVVETIWRAFEVLLAIVMVGAALAWIHDELYVLLLRRKGMIRRAALPDPIPEVLSPWTGLGSVYEVRGGARQILVVRGARSTLANGTTEDGDPFYPRHVVACARVQRAVPSFHLPAPGLPVAWHHPSEIDPGLMADLGTGGQQGILLHDGWMACYVSTARPDQIAKEADRLLGIIERWAFLSA